MDTKYNGNNAHKIESNLLTSLVGGHVRVPASLDFIQGQLPMHHYSPQTFSWLDLEL